MLRFDGKVVVITGAGGGLGRSHALAFGSRGAKVVVNDLGGSPTGEGKSSSAADKVVEEIRSAGGEAVASYDSVESGDKIIQCALDHFGRVDVVVNNAGILRDKSFHKMTVEDWDLIYRVHVNGSFRVTFAAWPRMRDQQYGRIVMTSSAAGLYGNFGQANYSMAKLGLLGFANTLAHEGRGKNIHVNTIAPIAGSRLTETVLPKELIDELKPEYVSPLVAWLCHEECTESGSVFEVGGGFFAKLRWERAEGVTYRRGRSVTAEMVRDDFGKISSFERSTYPTDAMSSMQPILANVQAPPTKGGNQYIDVDAALGFRYPESTWSYDAKDVALYALGVGAAGDPVGPELRYVYELHQDGFTVLPTFGVLPAVNSLIDLAKRGQLAPGLNFSFDRILHGEQYTELKRPLPPKATLTQRCRIDQIWDKGKNAVVVMATDSFDETGELLIVNHLVIVARGCGGWGGDRGPSVEENVPPDRKPDAVIEERISPNQALLYRLTGDVNPIHADPAFASAVGFERPILHGLCTFGYAGRHVIRAFENGDPRRFKSIKVRMTASVFPGETLVTEMWKESPTKVVLVCKAKERDAVVIKGAAVELYEKVPEAKAKEAKPKVEPSAAGEPTSAVVFGVIRDYVAAHPELVAKVATVFKFELTNPDSVYTIDLRSGSVGEGETAKPECTLRLTDADFMAMTKGAADPQKLFMEGRLKISGNIMASQKLSFLKQIDPKAAPAKKAAAAEPSRGAAKAPAIFERVAKRSPKRAGGARLAFRVTEPASDWVVDLAAGSVERGAGSADATLTLTDEDLEALTQGAEPRELFQRGRLRIEGTLARARDLAFLREA